MADLKAMWKLLEESGGSHMMFKFYRNEGDEKPFRVMVLVQGEQEVADVVECIDALTAD